MWLKSIQNPVESSVKDVGLIRMGEEEKMARDIYQFLNEKWDQQGILTYLAKREDGLAKFDL